MRIQFKLLSIALLVAGAAAQAQQAPSALYGELALAPIQIKGEADAGTSKNLRGIIGYELHPNVAIEGMVSFGLKAGSVIDEGERVETRIDHAYGVYLKPKIALTADLEAFARLGYASSKYASTEVSTGDHASDTKSSASYGLGLSYRINDKLSAVVDYMRYYAKHDIRFQGVSVGVRMKF